MRPAFSTDKKGEHATVARLVRDAKVDQMLPDRAARKAFLRSDAARPALGAWAELCGTIDALRVAVVAADDAIEGTRRIPLLASLHEVAEHTSMRLHNELQESESRARTLARDFRDCCGLWSVINGIPSDANTATAPSPLSTPPTSPSAMEGVQWTGRLDDNQPDARRISIMATIMIRETAVDYIVRLQDIQERMTSKLVSLDASLLRELVSLFPADTSAKESPKDVPSVEKIQAQLDETIHPFLAQDHASLARDHARLVRRYTLLLQMCRVIWSILEEQWEEIRCFCREEIAVCRTKIQF